MILSEIGETLQNILNNENIETSEIQNPLDYYFKVETVGFHIDKVSDKQKSKNFIPVFIYPVGGENDPIPDLEKSTYTVATTIYFPVRFKKDFFSLESYLRKIFVGKIHNYGEYSGKALTNISILTFGEIEEFDMKEFSSWIHETYHMDVEIHEPWFSLTFQIYFNSIKGGAFFGNNVKFQLKYNDLTEDCTFISNAFGLNNSPAAQQLIDYDYFAKNVVNITNRSNTIIVYPKNNEFWINFIKDYNEGTINTHSIKLKKIYDFSDELTFETDVIILSINENIELGEVLSYVITLGDKLE